ncbi:hypothetical protein BGZ76_005318 [Entomortierella beljakovae]|nr:hypothetical protein BGZ76_005318 [Entomortierella beljakovae]
MFKGYSAWFSPELDTYKQPWRNHGGEEKELAEADIAFVSDQLTPGGDNIKPTMKILRPDWIEDSIQGKKRLSLKRYKHTFPALDGWDTSSYESEMAVGMKAFKSTKTVSLKPLPGQLHQPEFSIQDLTVTNSTIDDQLDHLEESIEEQELLSRRSISLSRTQTLSLPATKERNDNVDNVDMTSIYPDEMGHADIDQSDMVHEQIPDNVQENNNSKSGNGILKKRKLPGTIQRVTRSPPAMYNTQPGDDFFGSSPEMLDQDTADSTDGVPSNKAALTTNPTDQKHTAQERCRNVHQAVTYLNDKNRYMDTNKKRLLRDHSQLYIVDIKSCDISFHLKTSK